ncbi:hypothetical protein CYMTET_17263 [Cymbomonas tetramitiformis]|uniref:Uncharacterized protein n=1 Tax=Cymbomonas tetramitiformis TaxID=36881 RepID=A0AAE0GAP7_9CHLO|nr:hypothetical protein CYMTET_17263 [Cymbomonas tetramitiformis]
MCCEDRMVVTRAIPTIAGENFKMDDWHFGHSASRRFGSGHPRELRKRVHPGGFDFEDEVNFKGQRNETLRQRWISSSRSHNTNMDRYIKTVHKVFQGKYLKLGFEDPFPGLPKPPLTGAKVLAGYDRLDHHDPIHMHIEMLKKAGWSETEIEKIFTEDEEWFTDTMPPELKDILSRREQVVEDLDTPNHNGDGEDDEDDGDDFNFTRRELADASVTSIPPSVPTQAATAGSLHTAELMVVSEAADVSTVHPSVPTQATTAGSLHAAEPMVVSEATTASTVHLSMPAQAATASSLHAVEPMVVSEAAIASRIHPSVPAQAATAGYMHAAEPMVVSEAATTSSIPSLAVGIAGTHTSHSFASPPQLLGHGTDREVAVARLQEMREIL